MGAMMLEKKARQDGKDRAAEPREGGEAVIAFFAMIVNRDVSLLWCLCMSQELV